jgi:hypothetical protein
MRDSAVNITIELGELARLKLREAISAYGRSAFQEPRRCEAILRDYCPMAQREIFLLVSALRENIAAELLGGSEGLPESAVLAKLARRVAENLGLSAESARWAVESWQYALEDNPGLQGDGRGSRRVESVVSDTGFAVGSVDSQTGGAVNWPWLGMCFVAIASAMVALGGVGWVTFVHQWVAWQGALIEVGFLAGVLAIASFGQLLCGRSFAQLAPPAHQALDPRTVPFALMPEVLVLLLMPLVPVALSSMWVMEWCFELHVAGLPHTTLFHTIRSIESACLGVFLYGWVRRLTGIQGNIACSMLRRR